jgi:hypothetical protein
VAEVEVAVRIEPIDVAHEENAARPDRAEHRGEHHRIPSRRRVDLEELGGRIVAHEGPREQRRAAALVARDQDVLERAVLAQRGANQMVERLRNARVAQEVRDGRHDEESVVARARAKSMRVDDRIGQRLVGRLPVRAVLLLPTATDPIRVIRHAASLSCCLSFAPARSHAARPVFRNARSASPRPCLPSHAQRAARSA